MVLEGFDDTSHPQPSPTEADRAREAVVEPEAPLSPIAAPTAAAYCIAAEGALSAARYALEGGTVDRDAIVGLFATAVSALNVALYATHGQGVEALFPLSKL